LSAASNIVSPAAGCDEGGAGVLFPWILTTFDLKGFDFFKVLESFVRAEPKLAPEVIRVSHLGSFYLSSGRTALVKLQCCKPILKMLFELQ
jgi:Retinoblastoma-associated protein A domain